MTSPTLDARVEQADDTDYGAWLEAVATRADEEGPDARVNNLCRKAVRRAANAFHRQADLLRELQAKVERLTDETIGLKLRVNEWHNPSDLLDLAAVCGERDALRESLDAFIRIADHPLADNDSSADRWEYAIERARSLRSAQGEGK